MVTLRKLRFEDVESLSKWGLHTDVRLTHYDFRYYNKDDFHYWYRSKQRPPFRFIYALVDRGEVVGFVTMKHINWLLRTAEFGLVIDPNHLDEGIGTEGLKKFIVFFFNHLHMKELRLKVSQYNSRAQKVYHKLGFEDFKTAYYPFEDQTRNFELLLNTTDFIMKGSRLMSMTHFMRLRKDTFQEIHENKPSIKIH